ncbi:Oligoendopeptidase F, plasmid [Mycoplasmopsis californica]|uniref:Oligopeptidase F n=1 Tax=Mycoplasmopsis equigenitalium TaxID=114883 RepID=A0ABY5J4C1_9BACT|nr:oligoendopeptidase F [Mycoplasmopsis equigenitalium]UUD36982.1 oligoendopeptidase F [Mycoplasmopsis equigenitalium]VEU69722.1 Oligoendopeptidase F, plasmid [Mycoplasmopsis californica]
MTKEGGKLGIKQYKNRDEIDPKYKWNLEVLLDNITPEQALENLIAKSKDLLAVKDSKYENASKFLAAKKIEEEFTLLFNKFYNYVSNKLSENVVDKDIALLHSKFEHQYSQFTSELGSEEVRILQNESKIRMWCEQDEFKPYKKNLLSVLDSKPHKLSDEVEDYLTKVAFGAPSPEQVFSIIDNSEIDYGYAKTSSGKKIKITKANLASLSKHKDFAVRKSARLSFEDAYLKRKNSYSALLFDEFKSHVADAKVRKFNSTVEMLIYEDRIDDRFITTLYDAVKSNLHIFKKYHKYKKKFFKKKFNKSYTRFDTQVELVDIKTNYSVEEAQQLVLDALTPFGDEYIKQIQKAFNENWVDYMVVDNKRSGAYSIDASYGLDKKYILMNFDHQLRSVETLAHELGHSMHSYYSDGNLSLEEAQYPIFLAEIASIFNELMLYDHLLTLSPSHFLSFSILNSIINGFIGTVMRQIEWSNYEYNLYKAIENGAAAPSYDSLSKIYFANAQEYDYKSNKKDKKFNENEQIGCIYVPHYYMNFYVYKYAIGQLVANIFFERYKQHGAGVLQDYIKNFLSAGGKKWPLDILKDNGIDLYDSKVYDLGFKNIESIIDQWIKIGKKIFK